MNNERGIVAEFFKDSGGRLRMLSLTAVIDGRLQTYDVDHSRRYGYIFHQSGSGGGKVPVHGIYFLSGDVPVEESPVAYVDARDKPPWRGKRTLAIRERNKTRRLRRAPRAFADAADLLDWLERNAIESEPVYCSTCRDWLPDSELCAHVWWCDKTCWWSTPSERCKCANREECYGDPIPAASLGDK